VNKSFFGDHQMNGLLPVEGMEEDGGEEREDEEEGQMQLDGQEEGAQNAKNDGHHIDFSMLAFQLLQHSQAQQAAAAAAAGISMNGQSQQQEQQQKENKVCLFCHECIALIPSISLLSVISRPSTICLLGFLLSWPTKIHIRK
jgi:hypothetical protein